MSSTRFTAAAVPFLKVCGPRWRTAWRHAAVRRRRRDSARGCYWCPWCEPTSVREWAVRRADANLTLRDQLPSRVRRQQTAGQHFVGQRIEVAARVGLDALGDGVGGGACDQVAGASAAALLRGAG